MPQSSAQGLDCETTVEHDAAGAGLDHGALVGTTKRGSLSPTPMSVISGLTKLFLHIGFEVELLRCIGFEVKLRGMRGYIVLHQFESRKRSVVSLGGS